MPATERLFDEPLPTELYLDTDILIAHLNDSDLHHVRTVPFLERIAQNSATVVYISSFSWVEFIHVVVRERFRTSLPLETRQRLRISRWDEPLVRQAYLQAFVRALDELLAQFRYVEIELTSDIRATALHYVAQFNLGGQDAVHLASSTRTGVFDFTSFDEAFRKVDGLTLWNDQIHTAAP
jgi:predicted nucleic acid-binding protein